MSLLWSTIIIASIFAVIDAARHFFRLTKMNYFPIQSLLYGAIIFALCWAAILFFFQDIGSSISIVYGIIAGIIWFSLSSLLRWVIQHR